MKKIILVLCSLFSLPATAMLSTAVKTCQKEITQQFQQPSITERNFMDPFLLQTISTAALASLTATTVLKYMGRRKAQSSVNNPKLFAEENGIKEASKETASALKLTYDQIKHEITHKYPFEAVFFARMDPDSACVVKNNLILPEHFETLLASQAELITTVDGLVEELRKTADPIARQVIKNKLRATQAEQRDLIKKNRTTIDLTVSHEAGHVLGNHADKTWNLEKKLCIAHTIIAFINSQLPLEFFAEPQTAIPLSVATYLAMTYARNKLKRKRAHKNEFEADNLVQNVPALIDQLEALKITHGDNDSESHPSLSKRIQELQNNDNKLLCIKNNEE